MDFKRLISQIQATNDFFKSKVSRSIDRHLTIRNCVIGFYIVEYEQGGRDRADYGTKLLATIASNLSLKGLLLPSYQDADSYTILTLKFLGQRPKN